MFIRVDIPDLDVELKTKCYKILIIVIKPLLRTLCTSVKLATPQFTTPDLLPGLDSYVSTLPRLLLWSPASGAEGTLRRRLLNGPSLSLEHAPEG